MKIVRYLQGSHATYGELAGESILPLEGSLEKLTRVKGGSPVPLKSTKLLAPTLPSKVVAIGPGYKAHLKGGPGPERPYYWIKPSTAVLDPEGEVVLPPHLTVNHESEIAIVISQRAKNVSPQDAGRYILGYTCCLDVTAGDMSDRVAYMQSQLFLDGKIFDTFAPLGPMIVTDLDTSDLRVQCRINGKIRQDHRTSDKLFAYDKLVSMISHVLTLLPGDVISTGSPPGVSPIAPGDTIEVEVEGIGILRTRAVAGK
jgi:2-keto-4-pentenoate hydratase/2-oxohepta-3-ene-1,7-dioic acid hydratase in catechol pathway